jgi:hypothetical protein
MRQSIILIAAATALLAGCAAPKVAQKKSVVVAGQTLEFGGIYETRGYNLSISVNGDSVMSGSFPPYTPTLALNATYKGVAVRAECYFASVLGGKRGVIGIVASAVQSANDRAGDKCEILANGKVVESLYF